MGGVVTNNKELKELYKMADHALYKAKKAGRSFKVERFPYIL